MAVVSKNDKFFERGNQTFSFHLSGACIADKLKLAFNVISTEIEHLEEKIDSFEYCKFKLQDIVKRPGAYRDLAINRYLKCSIDIECKLNRWLAALKYRKYDIKHDLIQMEAGWVPYLKKCKLFASYLCTIVPL